MSNETAPSSTEGSETSGLMVFLRVIGVLVVAPALILYLISLVAS